MILGGVVAVTVVAVGAFWQGSRYGRDQCTLEYQAELLKRQAEGERLEADRREAMHERDALVRQLEDAANAEPVVVNECLGASRVRRLNAIR